MIDKTAMMEDESLFRFLNSGDAPVAPSGDGGDSEPAASKARPVGRRAIRAQPVYSFAILHRE
jgi:hypothetical protein